MLTYIKRRIKLTLQSYWITLFAYFKWGWYDDQKYGNGISHVYCFGVFFKDISNTLFFLTEINVILWNNLIRDSVEYIIKSDLK